MHNQTDCKSKHTRLLCRQVKVYCRFLHSPACGGPRCVVHISIVCMHCSSLWPELTVSVVFAARWQKVHTLCMFVCFAHVGPTKRGSPTAAIFPHLHARFSARLHCSVNRTADEADARMQANSLSGPCPFIARFVCADRCTENATVCLPQVCSAILSRSMVHLYVYRERSREHKIKFKIYVAYNVTYLRAVKQQR